MFKKSVLGMLAVVLGLFIFGQSASAHDGVSVAPCSSSPKSCVSFISHLGSGTGGQTATVVVDTRNANGSWTRQKSFTATADSVGWISGNVGSLPGGAYVRVGVYHGGHWVNGYAQLR